MQDGEKGFKETDELLWINAQEIAFWTKVHAACFKGAVSKQVTHWGHASHFLTVNVIFVLSFSL